MKIDLKNICFFCLTVCFPAGVVVVGVQVGLNSVLRAIGANAAAAACAAFFLCFRSST